MKARPLKVTDKGYTTCGPEEATHVMLNTPGPIPNRILPVMIGGTRKGTSNWTWNGDIFYPTLRPSILSNTNNGQGEIRCHSWVTDGKIQFLSDSTHELAGQTLDLLDVEYGVMTESRVPRVELHWMNPKKDETQLVQTWVIEKPEDWGSVYTNARLEADRRKGECPEGWLPLLKQIDSQPEPLKETYQQQ